MMNATTLALAASLLAATYGTFTATNTPPAAAPYAVRAGDAVRVTATLTEAEANALGYALVTDAPPACGTNEYAAATGWALTQGRIVRTYEVRQVPPRVRRYSKLRLVTAAKKMGLWTRLTAFVEQADLTDEWEAAQYFEDGNAYFVAGTNAVITTGAATAAEVEQLLAEGEDDD